MGFESNMKATSVSDMKPLVLLGNGINRIAGRNAGLAWSEVEKNYCSTNAAGEKIIDNRFFEICKTLKPTFAHYALASLSDYIDKYLTTNYDYALEYALNASINKDKVIHIHGEAEGPEQCIFFKSQYKEAWDFIKTHSIIGNYDFQSWFDLILTHEVHICGLALEQNEYLLYHLLHLRRNRIIQRSDFDIDESVRPIYAWLMYTPQEKEKTIYLANYLKGLSVRPILIPVQNGNFVPAWERVIGRLMLHFNNIRVWRDDSSKLVPSNSAQRISTGFNCSYSSVEDFKYPDRCLIKISTASLLRHDKKKYWCFYCDLADKLYLWRIPMEALLPLIQDSQSRIFLYLSYINGSLYYSPQVGNPAALIATCSPIPDIVKFDSLISRA